MIITEHMRILLDAVNRSEDSHVYAMKAFKEVGDIQRGEPEFAMLRVQRVNGGGVMNVAAEHTNDLLHRMVNQAIHNYFGINEIDEKTKRILRYLRDSFGFEREHIQNMTNNSKHFGKTPEEQFKAVNAALRNMAHAHSELKVYNKWHWVARQATIDLGTMNLKNTEKHVQMLRDLVDQGEEIYNKEVSAYQLDENGLLIEYQP